MDSSKLLERYLLEQIPITAAMGVKVESASSKQVILRAPLSNNINHKKSVFGGSLHAVATLACWSLLYVNLVALKKYHIVITSSHIEYISPVLSDFRAVCCMPGTDVWERFLKILRSKGKGRIELQATILHNELLCVDYTGTFVAMESE